MSASPTQLKNPLPDLDVNPGPRESSAGTVEQLINSGLATEPPGQAL